MSYLSIKARKRSCICPVWEGFQDRKEGGRETWHLSHHRTLKPPIPILFVLGYRSHLIPRIFCDPRTCPQRNLYKIEAILLTDRFFFCRQTYLKAELTLFNLFYKWLKYCRTGIFYLFFFLPPPPSFFLFLIGRSKKMTGDTFRVIQWFTNTNWVSVQHLHTCCLCAPESLILAVNWGGYVKYEFIFFKIRFREFYFMLL